MLRESLLKMEMNEGLKAAREHPTEKRDLASPWQSAPSSFCARVAVPGSCCQLLPRELLLVAVTQGGSGPVCPHQWGIAAA